jgi:hypothetical protein
MLWSRSVIRTDLLVLQRDESAKQVGPGVRQLLHVRMFPPILERHDSPQSAR